MRNYRIFDLGSPAVFFKTRGFPSLPHGSFGFIWSSHAGWEALSNHPLS